MVVFANSRVTRGRFDASRGLVGAPGGLKTGFRPSGRDLGAIEENRLFDPRDPYMAPATGPVPPYQGV